MTPTPDSETLRASRLELVDEHGQVRAVVGDLGGPGGSGAFGIALLDAGGRSRAWLSLEPTGPSLVLDQGGNLAVHIGVNDPTSDALHEGAFIHLSDRSGRPVASWVVQRDGSLSVDLDGAAGA